jgi:hypothetical protein
VRYANAAAFRAALEARLNLEAREGGRPIGRARKFVAFTRLLARLQASAPDAWALKGGFALELRLPGRARATRDVDLDWRTGVDDATEALIAASRIDLDDYFEFAIARVDPPEAGAGGGVRFRAEVLLAGRQFEQLLIDVGLEAGIQEPFEQLDVPDLLGFAGIDPPVFLSCRSSSTWPRRFTPTRADTAMIGRVRGLRISSTSFSWPICPTLIPGGFGTRSIGFSTGEQPILSPTSCPRPPLHGSRPMGRSRPRWAWTPAWNLDLPMRLVS